MQMQTENKAKMFTLKSYSSNCESTLPSSKSASISDCYIYGKSIDRYGVGGADNPSRVKPIYGNTLIGSAGRDPNTGATQPKLHLD